MQKWFNIIGHEGTYWINKLGEVKSIRRFGATGKILKPTLVGYYKQVTLCKNGIKKKYDIHRLVALTFIPNPDNKKVVCHKNGDSQDNNIENLYWGTQKENIHDAIRQGRKAYGEKASFSILNEAKVKLLRRMYFDFNWPMRKLYRVFGKIYGISEGGMRGAIKRNNWKHI